MKKLITSGLLISALLLGFSQNPDFSKIKFWTGNGSKVAMLVIDFNDGITNECLAWGYRYSGNNVTAQNMLNDIVANDTNLSTSFSGGFLSNINYINHSGIGGSPYYWSTFTFTNNNWNMNMGYSEILSDSMIFGNSYTDFDISYNPISIPENPIPASKPFILNSDNVTFWTGSGSKSAYLVVDFNDSSNPQCFVWGYKFNGDTINAEQMINEITAADYHFQANIGSGFLNDIIYLNHSGIGGNPNYWASFTISNFIWASNWGISEILQNNSVFGLSYTDWDEQFNPIFEPEDAVPASIHTNIFTYKNNPFTIYPNPATNSIQINSDDSFSNISILNLNGEILYHATSNFSNSHQIDISQLAKGSYILKIENNRSIKHKIFVKE